MGLAPAGAGNRSPGAIPFPKSPSAAISPKPPPPRQPPAVCALMDGPGGHVRSSGRAQHPASDINPSDRRYRSHQRCVSVIEAVWSQSGAAANRPKPLRPHTSTGAATCAQAAVRSNVLRYQFAGGTAAAATHQTPKKLAARGVRFCGGLVVAGGAGEGAWVGRNQGGRTSEIAGRPARKLVRAARFRPLRLCADLAVFEGHETDPSGEPCLSPAQAH